MCQGRRCNRNLSDTVPVTWTTKMPCHRVYKDIAGSALLAHALTSPRAHMNSSPYQPMDAKPVDADLVEQATPGHGVPSQDPNLAAQVALSPEESERESKSTLVGGGLVAGKATGAAVGAVVAGPVGVLVGGMVGAVAGAIGGAGAGSLAARKTRPLLKISRNKILKTHGWERCRSDAGGKQPSPGKAGG